VLKQTAHQFIYRQWNSNSVHHLM